MYVYKFYVKFDKFANKSTEQMRKGNSHIAKITIFIDSFFKTITFCSVKFEPTDKFIVTFFIVHLRFSYNNITNLHFFNGLMSNIKYYI